MNQEAMHVEPLVEPMLLRNWIRVTALGWLVGSFLVVILAMAWGSFAGESQFMVGVGMGAGVGFFQMRALRGWFPGRRRWFWTSTLGLGLPFLLWDVTPAAGGGTVFSLPVCVVFGSLLVGILQARVLKTRYRNAVWWIPACLVGWGIPVGLIALGDSALPGPWSLLSLVVMLLGGFILGPATGAVLIRMQEVGA